MDIAARPVEHEVKLARTTWREEVLTRAHELKVLADWLSHQPAAAPDASLHDGLDEHLHDARQAAQSRSWRFWSGSLMGRAKSNLDAAEADLLQLAPAAYVEAQMPSLLSQVQRHLQPTDARRVEFEAIAQDLGVTNPPRPRDRKDILPAVARRKLVTVWRSRIVSVTRAASSASLREQLRVRSFRNVLIVTTVLMVVVAGGIALLGAVRPDAVTLCFEPQEVERTTIVCPTGRSGPLTGDDATNPVKISQEVEATAGRGDLFIVELVGVTAAAVAAAAALRRIRGSSEPYALPAALAVLKLPTGAVTAFLGLLLMRGQFVPGLSALDTRLRSWRGRSCSATPRSCSPGWSTNRPTRCSTTFAPSSPASHAPPRTPPLRFVANATVPRTRSGPSHRGRRRHRVTSWSPSRGGRSWH
jgi:hypothetical protein